MPELPEVETTRQGLLKTVLGATIADVDVRDDRNLRYQSSQEFQQLCREQTITCIDRRGKFLILALSHQGYLVIHLRMTGQLIYGPADTQAKLVFRLSDREHPLNFIDQRVFGEVSYVSNLAEHKGLQRLGPEPLDEQFTAQHLFDALRKRSIAIKTALLDQTLMVGMGNIYVNEALFQAKIHPLQPAQTLSYTQVEVLHQAMRLILQQAIELGGSSIRNYVNVSGSFGTFQLTYKVYGRKGLACPDCETVLDNVKIAQRSSVFCPQCQALRKD